MLTSKYPHNHSVRIHEDRLDPSYQTVTDVFNANDYETDYLTDMVVERLNKREAGDKPFFMVVSVQPPHVPTVAPPEYRRYQGQQLTLRPNVPGYCEREARFLLSGYYAQIENIDYNVGRIVDTLRQTNQIHQTHLMFFSDHGDQMGSHGRFGKCVPYEESARVPFLIGGGVPAQHQGPDPCEETNLALNVAYKSK